MSKKRINWLLILQGWAMLWVVIGHAFIGGFLKGPEWETVFCSIAYSFHMPLFMLVSGWLFYFTRLNVESTGRGGQKWTYGAIVKDKTIRLLLPGLVFSILAFVVKIAIPGEVVRQTSLNLNEIFLSFLYPFNNPFRELWFIAALFWMFILTPLWKAVLKYEWTIWPTFVVLMIFHFIHPETEFLSFDRVGMHALWFFLGIVMCKKEIVENVLSSNPYYTILWGVVLFILGFWSPFVQTLGGITVSFGLSLIADRYIPNLFSSFRNYTYQIFLIGIFAQIAVKIAYRHVSMPYILAYLLCIIVGVYFPVLVSKLIERINWYPLSLCVGLKTK